MQNQNQTQYFFIIGDEAFISLSNSWIPNPPKKKKKSLNDLKRQKSVMGHGGRCLNDLINKNPVQFCLWGLGVSADHGKVATLQAKISLGSIRIKCICRLLYPPIAPCHVSLLQIKD